jgi:hypothetical protein
MNLFKRESISSTTGTVFSVLSLVYTFFWNWKEEIILSSKGIRGAMKTKTVRIEVRSRYFIYLFEFGLTHLLLVLLVHTQCGPG